jgi:hypothetical protein
MVVGRVPDVSSIRFAHQLASVGGESTLLFFANTPASPEYRLRQAFLRASPRNGRPVGRVDFDQDGVPLWGLDQVFWARGRLDAEAMSRWPVGWKQSRSNDGYPSLTGGLCACGVDAAALQGPHRY